VALLLDTHALIWAVLDPERLTPRVRGLLEDGGEDVFVSAVSAMEISTKVRLGKLPQARSLSAQFSEIAALHDFAGLSISVEHAQLAGNLEIPHKDPFDRLLIAQSQIEQMRLVSNEALFDQFGVLRLW
jgi:PIN domain nuclease of toxin-antitoxin system